MGFFYNGRLYPFTSGLDLLRFDGIDLPGRVRYGLLRRMGGKLLRTHEQSTRDTYIEDANLPDMPKGFDC